MFFSIIVPIFNVEKYLTRCLESILEQTFPDFEVLLIDDGSTDSSGAICNAFCLKDSRLKYYKKENGGLSDARNFGLKQAYGDYIMFVDSDDSIDKEACQIIYDNSQTNPDIILGNAVRIVNDKKNVEFRHIFLDKQYSGYDAYKKMISSRDANMATWLNVYKRVFLIENDLNFAFGRLHEDEQFTPRALLCAKSVVDSKYCFYNYFVRENSIMTKKDKRKNAEDLYLTATELLPIYEKIVDKKFKNLLINNLVDLYLSVYEEGKLYKYYKKFNHKDFYRELPKIIKTKVKFFIISNFPQLYSFIHDIVKRDGIMNEE